MTKKEITKFIKNYWSSEMEMLDKLHEAKMDYLDDDWEDEFDNEYDWYEEYGHGEAEGELYQEIINALTKEMGEENNEWYHRPEYEYIDRLICEIWPDLDA